MSIDNWTKQIQFSLCTFYSVGGIFVCFSVTNWLLYRGHTYVCIMSYYGWIDLLPWNERVLVLVFFFLLLFVWKNLNWKLNLYLKLSRKGNIGRGNETKFNVQIHMLFNVYDKRIRLFWTNTVISNLCKGEMTEWQKCNIVTRWTTLNDILW